MSEQSNKIKRRKRPRVPIYKSVFDEDIIIRGNARQIAQRYKDLAKVADENNKERLLQFFDHWVRQASV